MPTTARKYHRDFFKKIRLNEVSNKGGKRIKKRSGKKDNCKRFKKS
jgi:hypothetical protein